MTESNLLTYNKVNRFISGNYKGIGFSMKDGILRIGKDLELESETRIRKEILQFLRDSVSPKTAN